MTPKQWYESVIGKSIDTDGFPSDQKYQCWDLFDYFCRKIGFSGSRKCALNGYVGDLWKLRDSEDYHYYTDFDYVYDPATFKTGDWVFWDKHVAMYYDGQELGQNQPYPYVTLKEMNWSGILGAMRWKDWQVYKIPYGYSIMTINEHKYTLRRMVDTDKIGVVSAGLNQVAPFAKLDADVLVNARIAGANYFQMRDDVDDPQNTTYGDISAPLNGVYQSLPNQISTLFYDLDTGLFGDCTDVNIDPTHNVFSPALVYPNSKGNWEYARMVGLSHKDLRSWYTFLIKFADGYALGIAGQEMTPQEIADDFAGTAMLNIAFLDGGGSAQASFWHDQEMDYVRDTGREVPSALIIYRNYINDGPVEMPPQVQPEEKPQEPEITPEKPPVSDETGKDEEDMPEQEKPQETPQETPEITPIPDWKDPDEINPELSPWTVILLNIANLFKVKSILTFALTGAYIALLFSNLEVPKFLETILTMVIGFYYGTQFDKMSGDKK